MTSATANGITIEYETFGKRGDPALLLVMGLGAQMTLWHPDFCKQLAEAGFFVIRYDNRDTGLSSKIEGGPAPDLAKAFAGDASSASYKLSDMAADGMGLLDALGIDKAHIVGASMGGMIVQQMAIDFPERVLSMTSIMSTTGNQAVGQSKPEAMAALMAPPPTSREGAIELAVSSQKIIGSTGYPLDEEELRAQAARDYDRCFYPAGIARQLLAIIASGDRTEALHGVKAPTLVIHGEIDPLVTLSGGQATADAIPDARLLVVAGMGHDLPRGAWDAIIPAIVENAQRAAVV